MQKGSRTMAFRKILLVDDSETILQMEQMILEPDCYELILARDGEEGVAKALATKPDLILMDVVMPKMNGFEAVKRLRDHEQTRTVPIVMVTSKAEAESMEAGYQNGCSDYIVKPIDRVELVAKIKNLLGD
jgi:DNA-binding response OmpR family regulator